MSRELVFDEISPGFSKVLLGDLKVGWLTEQKDGSVVFSRTFLLGIESHTLSTATMIADIESLLLAEKTSNEAEA